MEQLEHQFKWNEHGVCVQPEEKSYCNKRCCVRIYVASHQGKWYYGTSFGIYNPTECESRRYGAELPSLKGNGYAIKSDAIAKAYEQLKEECSDSTLLTECLKEAKSHLLQLELF